MEKINWPEKTREFNNHHFDSTIWNDFEFRDNDIFIATYAKSGTTWLQQIISKLIFNGEEGLEVAEMSPWVDLRVPPKEVKLPLMEQQTHRRFLKTHLPVDALVFSPESKYIYIGRDGRDVVNSMLRRTRENPSGYFGIPLRNPVEENVSKIEKQALQWKQVIEKINEDFKNLLENQYMEIRYEDLVSSPEQYIEKIFRFCELPNFNILYRKDGVIQNKEGKKK